MKLPIIAYQFANVGDKKVVICNASWKLTRRQGGAQQDGDVLSVMSDGTFKCSPFSDVGENELCTVAGAVLTYAVSGTEYIVVPGE